MAENLRVDFGPVMRQINSLGNTLSGQIAGVTSEVGQVRDDLRLTGDELRQLRADFDAYVDIAARTAAVQRSTTEVGNLKAELDREFGHYALVRRASIGTLQAFDVGIVSNDTVAAVSEELMIQTPRYWLAPALVALAAWSRDQRDTAEKAVQEAFSRDKNKTSLFFALVLRRQGRIDGSVRWLRHYLDSLDPGALTREFSVVLEAASYEAFGPAGQRLATQRIKTWVDHMRSSTDVIDQQVKRWVGEIGSSRRALDVSQYQTLAKMAEDFEQVQRQIESASALSEVRGKYEEIKDHVPQIPSVLEDMLDDILDTLVIEYDEEELPLRRKVVYHEAVISSEGDVDAASKRAAELQRALEETIDIVSLQTEAAINPENLGVSVHTQRISIGIAIGEFRAAVNRYTTEYRSRAIDSMTYKFNESHSNYASTFKFVGVDISSMDPEEQGIAAIQAAWQKSMDRYIEAASFKPKKFIIGGALAACIAILLMFANPIVGIVLLLLAGAVVGVMAMLEKNKADQAVREAEGTREKAVQDTVLLYREASAQLVDALDTYRELDAQEPGLLALIDAWPTAVEQEEAA